MFLRHPVLSIVTLAYLGVVAWITLGPQPFSGGSDSMVWRALRFLRRFELTDWVTYSGIEFTGNVLMFLPIGLFFLLLLGRRNWWVAIIVGVILTVAIETAQRFLPDRVSDIRDIVANSVGALVGVVVALILTAGKARQLRQAASLPRAERARA